MGDGAAGVLDRAAQFLARQVAVADDVDQYAAQWGVAFQLAEGLGRVLVVAQHVGDLFGQAARHDQPAAQGQQALEYQGQTQHGCRQRGQIGQPASRSMVSKAVNSRACQGACPRASASDASRNCNGAAGMWQGRPAGKTIHRICG